MEVIYRNNIFNSILHRYSTILIDYDINDTANKIIQKIMANEIQVLFGITQDLQRLTSIISSEDRYFGSEYSHWRDIPFVDMYDFIIEELEEYYHEEATLINKSISNTIEEVTLSLLLLLQPDKESVRESIRNIHEIVSPKTQQEKILEKLMIKDSSEFDNLINSLSLVKLRDIYKKYMRLRQEND
jgi:hypothetical protein